VEEFASEAAVTATGMAEPESGEEVLATEEEERATESSPVDDAESRPDALLRLGRSGDADAFYVIRSWLGTPEPQVRAAAYQALGHLLERDPARLEPHIRWGIADPDGRVRRRVVLAAAAARGLALRPLLEPLRQDPDPQVRRVVHEVLRRIPPTSDDTRGAGSPTSEEVTSGVAY
jgi:HEAT repeat protein